MLTYSGMPFAISTIFIKVAGNTEAVSIPLCEALMQLKNVVYDRDSSVELSKKEGSTTFCLTGDTDKEKAKRFNVTAKELASRLQVDIYENQFKISDLVIQSEGELMYPEVTQFLNL